MISPGVYRHFKGPEYRVLFVVLWTDFREPPAEDEVIRVKTHGADDSSWMGAARRFEFQDHDELVIEAVWSGERAPLKGNRVVIYCNLGGVYARTEVEFEETLSAGRERFVRLGS